MQKAKVSGGEDAAEQTVWCAREGSQVIEKRTTLHTGSSAICAKWHKKWSTMREKQDAIAIPEGWSTKMASGTSKKTTPSGNTALWNMVEKRLNSQ